MKVELRTFLKTLKIEAQDEGETIIVGGFPISVETNGNVRYIPLRDIVDAAGLRLFKNPQLGTIDVRGAAAGTGSRGDWHDSGTHHGSSRKKGTTTQIEGPHFSVSVPGHIDVLADPAYLKSGESDNAKSATLNSPWDIDQSVKGVFVATRQSGNATGTLTVSYIKDMPKDIAQKDEKFLLSAITEGVKYRGGN